MSISSTNKYETRLAALGSDFTIVSAYLNCPEKEPSIFLEILGGLFQAQSIELKDSDELMDTLATAWTEKVKAEPTLQNNPCAPHAFLGVMKEHGFWDTKLSLGNAS